MRKYKLDSVEKFLIIVAFACALFVFLVEYSINNMLLSNIKDVVVSVSAILTAIVAYKGFSMWRIQLKGKNEYQLAKNILQKSYEFQETLKQVRSPFIAVGELKKRKEIMDLDEDETKYENEEEASILDQSFAYFERFKKLQPITTNLRVLKYEAAALWGKEKVREIEMLIGKERELFLAYDMYFRGKLQRWGEKEIEQKFHKDIYFHGSDDEFSKNIDDILGKIESSLRKYI